MNLAEENELKKKVAETYWKAECRWQAWRKNHPKDMRNGSDYSGSPEEDGIAADWKVALAYFKEWEDTHPAPKGYFWGIKYPEHVPELMAQLICGSPRFVRANNCFKFVPSRLTL